MHRRAVTLCAGRRRTAGTGYVPPACRHRAVLARMDAALTSRIVCVSVPVQAGSRCACAPMAASPVALLFRRSRSVAQSAAATATARNIASMVACRMFIESISATLAEAIAQACARALITGANASRRPAESFFESAILSMSAGGAKQ